MNGHGDSLFVHCKVQSLEEKDVRVREEERWRELSAFLSASIAFWICLCVQLEFCEQRKRQMKEEMLFCLIWCVWKADRVIRK